MRKRNNCSRLVSNALLCSHIYRLLSFVLFCFVQVNRESKQGRPHAVAPHVDAGRAHSHAPAQGKMIHKPHLSPQELGIGILFCILACEVPVYIYIFLLMNWILIAGKVPSSWPRFSPLLKRSDSLTSQTSLHYDDAYVLHDTNEKAIFYDTSSQVID